MSRIQPEEVPELPVPFMNEDHRREIGLVNDVAAALDARAGVGVGALPAALEPVVERLALLAVQMREHFLHEEAAMRVSRFPGYAVHRAEHDRVLAQMDREARAFRDDGDAARLARYLFEGLPAWYRGHVRAMDAEAARHLAAMGGDEAAAP